MLAPNTFISYVLSTWFIPPIFTSLHKGEEGDLFVFRLLGEADFLFYFPRYHLSLLLHKCSELSCSFAIGSF